MSVRTSSAVSLPLIYTMPAGKTDIAKRLVRLVLPAPLFRAYRRRKLEREKVTYESHLATHTYCGIPLQLSIEDPLAAGWYDHDWPMLPEIEILSRHRLKPGARVFDLGAHQCVVALILAHLVGETGSVVAIEGDPHNARVGRRNCQLNNQQRVRVENAVAADRHEVFFFDRELNGRVVPRPRIPWGTVRVPGTTIDDLAREHGRPDVVLIDVEGFEGRVLAGASQTLQEAKSDFLVEVHVDAGLEEAGASVHDILVCFPQSGYRLFVAPDAGQFQPYHRGISEVMRSRFFLFASAQAADLGSETALEGSE